MRLYKADINDFSQEEYDKYFSMMSESRKNAVLRMRIENDRKRSVLGESLARKAVSESTGIAESEIEFGRTEKGKPFCKSANIFFSISHSKNAVVCAVDGNEIGVDIERIRDIDLRITRIACTDADRVYILGGADADCESVTPTAEMTERFFRLWTAKEAYFKFIGTGIEGLKNVSYADIAQFCTTTLADGYAITVYSEKQID